MNIDKLKFTDVNYDLVNVDITNINQSYFGCFDSVSWSKYLDNRNNIEICELGSWYGYGAAYLSKYLLSKNKSFKIVCVDTWLGSLEHLIDAMSLKALKINNGFPQFYYEFLNVLKYFQVQDYIIPFPNTTVCFGNACKKLECRFDVVIVDASHQYEDVIIDLNIAWSILKDGGVIIGDDFVWGGVRKALEEFVSKNQLKYTQINHNQYVIEK